MNFGWFFISLLVTFAALTVALPTCVEVYHRYRRSHFVQCPKTRREASVVVSPGVAAASSAFLPTHIHFIKSCSLWPEYRRCGCRCLSQLRP